MAPERAARPGATPPRPPRHPVPPYDPDCPFCPGNESQAAPELYRDPESGPDWRVRVVANKYPALVEGAAEGDRGANGPLRQRRPSLGRHEVTIDSPHHDHPFSHFDDDQVLAVMRAYRHRFAAAAADPRIRHIVIFRNHGRRANASMVHPHSQLAALDFVPAPVASRLERAGRHFERAGRPLLIDVTEDELADEARLVERSDRFATFVPYAPSHESEILVVPRFVPPRYDACDDALLREAGGALRRAVAAMWSALEDPDYNCILHTPPLQEGAEPVSPWYFQVIPRQIPAAGFEMALGVRILSTSPEDSAAALRAALGTVARP